MSSTTTSPAHIAYELTDETRPDVMVIEFLSGEISGPVHARELGEQLESLIRSDSPRVFVLDFANVRSLGSTAFGEIVSFARKVTRLYVCNLRENLRLGAALIGLDDWAQFALNRWGAIAAARRTMRDEDDTVDYPASWVESNEADHHAFERA